MIAIIPARGGSKGLPNKNIKPLLGKPLIAYTIEAALNSTEITDVIVSTDNQQIYDLSIELGANETFLRPSELAQDNSLAIDNYTYTINKLSKIKNTTIEEFIVLQPTSPLRDHVDIDNAISLFHTKKADSVVSYTEELHPINWHKHINNELKFENIFPENIQNRQENKVSYYPNGAIFVFKFELIKAMKYYSNNSYAYIMKREKSVDIDNIHDFEYAEFLLRKSNEKRIHTKK